MVELLEGRTLLAATPQTWTVAVNGKANIYSALLAVPPSPGGGGGGVKAPAISFAPSTKDRVITIDSTAGTVSGWAAAGHFTDADGGAVWGGVTRVPAWAGISGIIHTTKTMFMTGVFWSSTLDKANMTAPAIHDYTAGDSIHVFRPQRRQQVYLGNGLDTAGAKQSFIVPAGADRLSFGFAENLQFHFLNRLPGYYNDNGGGLTIHVSLSGTSADLALNSLAWNSTKGGVTVGYAVTGSTLTTATDVNLYWASGSTVDTVLGTPIATKTLTTGTKAGAGTWDVAGSSLKNAPAGATQLLAVIDSHDDVAESNETNNIKSILDTRVIFGSGAVASVVSAKTLTILKELLRAAGQATGTITSTARTPAQQAKVMFDNCRTLGVASQYKLYAAAGDQVIDVYVAKTKSLTPAQVLAQAATIQAAMLAKINQLGPSNVSLHCADPAVKNVIDVSPSMTGKGAALFKAAALADTRVSKFLFPPTDPAFHIEVPQA